MATRPASSRLNAPILEGMRRSMLPEMLLSATLAAVGCSPPRADILFVVTDTIRADRVRSLGYVAD